MNILEHTDIFTKNKLVIYHKNCVDGFTSAFVAWKKFGDTTDYHAAEDRNNLPVDLQNKLKSDLESDKKYLSELEVFVIDYSYPLEVMKEIEEKVKKFTILDHHISAKEAIESMKHHVYGTDKSGAYLAWEYFFPTEPVPKLIQYVSDNDTWAHALPNWKEISNYIYDSHEFTFSIFDSLCDELETERGFDRALDIGGRFAKSRAIQIDMYVKKAEIIDFEGTEVYAVNCPGELRSEVGHELAKKTGTFAVLYYYENGAWKCSLRGAGTVDVSQVAAKHGGGGHHDAASFIVQSTHPLLFLSGK